MKNILPLFVCLLLSQLGVAKDVKFRDVLEIGAFSKDAVLTVEDEKFSIMQTNANWPDLFENTEVKDYVTVYIDHNSNIYQPESYSVEVVLEVSYDIWNGTVFETITDTKTALLDYSKDGEAYKDKVTLVYEGGHKVSVKVVDVIGTANIMNIALDAVISVNRFEAFDASIPAVVSHSIANVSTRGELDIEWPEVVGAEEYDLEWTFVGGANKNQAETNPSLLPLDNKTFRVNSTRVSVTGNSYSIPLIYEEGFIVYRLRAIGTHKSNRRLFQYGPWSSGNISPVPTKVSDFVVDGQLHYQYFSGHQNDKNWQYIANYAEEGKSKIGVSYYDGSLKNRQTVSKLKEEDEVIASEVILDWQGRPGVTILPAPTGETKVDYQQNLNVNAQNEAYSWEDFDKDAGDCEASTLPLGTESGAGKYYSPENKDGGMSDYIPDAKGFPLSRTEYTPDNTGRIRQQGGVGPDHQLGSEHETKYFYGVPLQQELDRLFGSEVGVRSHYKKNLVQDPNGQASVSYVDMQGNTIATALAGATPAELEALDNQETREINSPLIQSDSKNGTDYGNQDNIGDKKETLILSEEALVSTRGPQTIDYTVEQEQYIVSCEDENNNPIELCYDCVLELSVMVVDECGTQFLIDPTTNSGSNFSSVIGQEVLDAITEGNYTASTPKADLEIFKLSDLGWADTEDLPVGNYTISKVLKVNQAAMDYYTEQYLAEDCILPFTTFLATEQSYIDVTGCDLSCEFCFEQLGDFNQYDEAVTPECDPCYTFEEYQIKYEQCEELCGLGNITCSSIKTMMLSDVSPLGQYAKGIDVSGEYSNGDNSFEIFVADYENGKDQDIFPLSVYNPGSKLPLAQTLDIGAPWRRPIHPDRDDLTNVTEGRYYNADGTAAIIRVYCKGLEVNLDYNDEGEGAVEARQDKLDAFNPRISIGAANFYLENSGKTVGDKRVLEAGYYNIRPQDLYSYTDFIALRPADNSWEESLIIYHPEYASLAICENLSQSHDFDDQLTYTNTTNPNFDRKWYDDPVSVDPYFDPNKNPYYSPIEKFIFQRALDSYKKKGTETFSLQQMAHVLTFCPTFEDLSTSVDGVCMEACFSDDFGTSSYELTDEEWSTFKFIYISLKQKLLARRQTHEMIKARSYNACMSDENFTFRDNRFHLYRARNYVYSNSNWFNWYYNREVFNVGQACSVQNFRLFKDKFPRFVVNQNLITGGATADVVCYSEPNLGEELTIEQIYEQTVEIIPCEEEELRMVTQMQEKANTFYLDQCGQCPIAYSFSQLLIDIIKNQPSAGLANESEIQLSCYPEGLGSFIPAIQEQFDLGIGLYKYQTTVIESNEGTNFVELRGKFFNDQNQQVELVLRMLPEYEVTDFNARKKKMMGFEWSDVNNFCCMEYLASGQEMLTDAEMATYAGKTFSIGGKVDVAQTGFDQNFKIYIEGYTTAIVLNECDETVCEDLAYNSIFLGAMNELAAKESSPDLAFVVNSDLVTTSPIDIVPFTENSTSPRDAIFQLLNTKEIINNELFTAYDGTQTIGKWTYSGTVNADVLSMVFTLFDSDNNNLGAITFSLTLNGIDPNRITSFSYTEQDLSRDNNGDLIHEFGKVFNIHTLIENSDGTRAYQDLGFETSIPLESCREYGYGITE